MSEKFQIRAGKGQFINAILDRPDPNITGKKKLTEIDRTLVIMSHGFPGHMKSNNDIFGDLAFLLAEKKFHTLRFDYRHCGSSGSDSENFSFTTAGDDFDEVLAWAKGRGYHHFIYIGEGTGATIAVLKADLETKAILLLWPVLDPRRYGQKTYEADAMNSTAQKAGFITKDGVKIGVNFIRHLENTDMANPLKEIFQPLLIMHGAKDEIIPVDQLNIARERVRSKRVDITTFHDGEHGLPKMEHRKMMLYHIGQFVAKYA